MTAKAVIQTRNPLDSPGDFPVIEQESSKGIVVSEADYT